MRPIAAALARKLCVPAEDLESTGAIALLEAVADFDPGRSVSLNAFLKFRIRGAMIDSVKGRPYREARHQQLPQAVPDAAPLPDELVGRRISAERLRAAIARLPDSERRLIELRFYEGVSARAAADRIGLSPAGQVRLRSRALSRLRSILVSGGKL